MNRIFASTNLIVFAACFAAGQTAPSQPAFEVASIKPSNPEGGGMQIGVSPGGVFTAKNVTLKALIQQAYEVRDFQISGGPGWLDTERYDITAKGQTGVSEDDVRKMTKEQRRRLEEQLLTEVRSLLGDRFQLRVHQDTKDLPVFALAVAKGGAKLKPAADGGDAGGGLTLRRGETGKWEMTGNRVPLASLVKILAKQVGRTVVDQTGLTGDYDFKMTFSPDIGQQSPDPGDEGGSRPAVDADGPSIFSALQVQLGLKLDAQKGPVEVVVIDSVQKPSAN
jgi:uncharacterized protein (TIGR03435 family)